MSNMISQEKFRKHVSVLKVPKGFTATMETEDRGWRNHPVPTLVYVVKSETIEVRFDQTGSGHTNFVQEGRELTFDRRGVEDSFYHLPFGDWDNEKFNLNKIFKEQLKRVARHLEYTKTALQVPGIPHTISPDGLVALRSNLKNLGEISFHPSGFGTGYIVTRRMVRGAKAAPKAMETFFGVSPLFVSTFEAD